MILFMSRRPRDKLELCCSIFAFMLLASIQKQLNIKKGFIKITSNKTITTENQTQKNQAQQTKKTPIKTQQNQLTLPNQLPKLLQWVRRWKENNEGGYEVNNYFTVQKSQLYFNHPNLNTSANSFSNLFHHTLIKNSIKSVCIGSENSNNIQHLN